DAVVAARSAGARHGRSGARSRGPAGDRSRARHLGRLARAGVPAVPAPGRPGWDGSGARARGRARLRARDGGRPAHRGHARGRHDRGREPRDRVVSLVLAVDDEPQLLRALITNLKARGYDVDAASTGEIALEMAARHHPDVVVLDLGLPAMSGIEVIHGLRGWTEVPIIVLSARDAEREKIAALDAGADDYVNKRFGMGEHLARVRASLRRGAS